jgi:hypothetical protein
VAAIRLWRLQAAVVEASRFFDGIVSSGSQYQLQSGKPVPGRDGEEPRSAREYSAATPRVLTISYPMAGGTDIALRRKNFELVGLLH